MMNSIIPYCVNYPCPWHNMLDQNRVIAKDVKRCTYCCYFRCVKLIVSVGGMPWPRNRYNSLPCTVRTSKKRGRAIKGSVVCKKEHVAKSKTRVCPQVLINTYLLKYLTGHLSLIVVPWYTLALPPIFSLITLFPGFFCSYF